VTLGYAAISIAAGGSYWPHYLLQLVVPVSLSAAVVAAGTGRWARYMRRTSWVAVGSAVVSTVVVGGVNATVPGVREPQTVGQWLAESATRSDTALVAYGSPAILESADLTSPYPYLWSLPMRTLDPEQRRLRATLRGPDAPTWLVVTLRLDSWGIDDGGRLRALVAARYRYVGEVCGHEVHLRNGVERELASLPDC
jgi:hypothetical protein